jgi:steroid delta-isomerase-like uncharacterized protein
MSNLYNTFQGGVMKKLCIIPSLVVILCFLVRCQDKEAMAELEEFRVQAALEEQNETLYRELIDELNKGNTAVFDEYFAPDYAYYFPSNTQESLSLEETRELVITHLKSFPDYKWNIEELYAAKDMIIARMSTWGTFKEEYQGIPATGDKVESSAIFIVRIEDGKIVEEREEVDLLNVMQQLGMELKPKAFGNK